MKKTGKPDYFDRVLAVLFCVFIVAVIGIWINALRTLILFLLPFVVVLGILILSSGSIRKK